MINTTQMNILKTIASRGLASVVGKPKLPINQTINTNPPLLPPFVKKSEPVTSPAYLTLKSGQVFKGTSFGAPLSTSSPASINPANSISGEVVFTTSLVGYPESMTDPSYHGQILVFTQPLIGNYGIPAPTRDEFGLLKYFESERVQVKGIVVSDYAQKYSHWNAVESLGHWCARYNIPAISGVDTRAIVTLLRDSGSTLGCISSDFDQQLKFDDPNSDNLIAKVSTKSAKVYNEGADLKIALIDCGVKQNIIRCLVQRGVEVTLLPHNTRIQDHVSNGQFDGVFISNGPGDPSKATSTIANIRELLQVSSNLRVPVPVFGICMGHQLLGLAAGFQSYKLPYGNRGHNQPCLNMTTSPPSCVITSQNHGYALQDHEGIVPQDWNVFFKNANDGSNEGIYHEALPFSSVQFHPEAKGGPLDTDFLFDEFVERVTTFKRVRDQISTKTTVGRVWTGIANVKKETHLHI